MFEEDKIKQMVERAASLSIEIKHKQEQLDLAKANIAKYMQDNLLDEFNTPYGKVVMLSYDKNLLNKDKTQKMIDNINHGRVKQTNIDDFMRVIGVSFPLIRMTEEQRQAVIERMGLFE